MFLLPFVLGAKLLRPPLLFLLGLYLFILLHLVSISDGM